MSIETRELSILPVYLVIDVSGSMTGPPLTSAQNAAEQIIREIKASPSLGEVAYMGVISFSSSAQVVLPMSNLSYLDTMPLLTAGGATSYRSAIDTLLGEVLADVGDIKKQGNKVYRPCVFFVTDGEPTDPSHELDGAIQRLSSSRPVPNVIPIGVAEAVPATLRKMATNGMVPWIAQGDIGSAMAEVARVLIRSVVSSIRNSQTANPTLDLTPFEQSSQLQPALDHV